MLSRSERERQKAYYEKNKVALRERSRLGIARRRAENPEEHRRYANEWRMQNKDRIAAHGKTYDASRPLRHVWRQMIKRCEMPTHPGYRDYGARGIRVCEAWVASYETFARDMGPRPKGMTVDRIDNNGPYSPTNCRWATSQTQANNNRHNRFLEHDNQRMTIAQWARALGISRVVLNNRLHRKWTVERTLTTPLLRQGR
jgi:hypothetical protein